MKLTDDDLSPIWHKLRDGMPLYELYDLAIGEIRDQVHLNLYNRQFESMVHMILDNTYETNR